MREIGLRCFFRSSTGFTFGNGETSANLQIFRRRCSLNEELMILVTGKANSSTYSLRSQLGISSGPHTFDGFSACSQQLHYPQLGYLMQLWRVSRDWELGQRLFQAIFFEWFKESLINDVCKFLVATILKFFDVDTMRLMSLPELDWDPLRRLTSFHNSFGFSSFMCSTLTL